MGSYFTSKGLSHLLHLVWLDCTRVCFPTCSGRLDTCECSSCTQACTKNRPNKRTETCLRMWFWYAFRQTLERFVCSENVIWRKSDPTAGRTVHYWTKPAAEVATQCIMRWALHFVYLQEFRWNVPASGFWQTEQLFTKYIPRHMWPMSDVNIITWLMLLHFGLFPRLTNWFRPVKSVVEKRRKI